LQYRTSAVGRAQASNFIDSSRSEVILCLARRHASIARSLSTNFGPDFTCATSSTYITCVRQLSCAAVLPPGGQGRSHAWAPTARSGRAKHRCCQRPPRRSQRALLTHWAPALGAGVESHARPRVHDPGWRQPPVSEAIHACPVQAPAPGLLRSASLRTWCTSRCAVCPQISQQRIDRLGRDPPLLGARPGEKFSDLRVPGGRVSDRRCQSETPQRP